MRSHCALLLVLLGSLAWAQQPSALVKQLRADLGGKTFLLRHFPAADHLEYDSSGQLQGDPGSTSWTLANIAVSQVQDDPNGIVLKGKRVMWQYNTMGNRLSPQKTGRKMEMLVKIAPAEVDKITPAEFESKLFYQNISEASGDLPDFWSCYLQREFGIRSCPNSVKDSHPSQSKAKVSPPKPLETPDPRISKLSYEVGAQPGISVLQMIVGTDGKAADIEIVRPLGGGLDEAAVDAVRNWRFRPASVDGVPTPVTVNVEVVVGP